MSQDFVDITQCVYMYAYGIDTRDWVLYRNIFVDEITTDFSSFSGQPASKAPLKADDWVSGLKPLFHGLDATQHSMSNPLVDIDGDSARCRMYMQAEHFFQNSAGSADFAIGGYYDDKLTRTADGWKVTAVTLNVFWSRGNRDIMARARERGMTIVG